MSCRCGGVQTLVKQVVSQRRTWYVHFLPQSHAICPQGGATFTAEISQGNRANVELLANGKKYQFGCMSF